MWHRPAPEDHEDDRPSVALGLIEDPCPPSQPAGITAPPGTHLAAFDVERRRELGEALQELRSSCQTGVCSSKRMIDPLLDLWSLAAGVDRTAARPIEPLLKATVERSVITSDELSACIDRIETILSVLSASTRTRLLEEDPR